MCRETKMWKQSSPIKTMCVPSMWGMLNFMWADMFTTENKIYIYHLHCFNVCVNRKAKYWNKQAQKDDGVFILYIFSILCWNITHKGRGEIIHANSEMYMVMTPIIQSYWVNPALVI